MLRLQQRLISIAISAWKAGPDATMIRHAETLAVPVEIRGKIPLELRVRVGQQTLVSASSTRCSEPTRLAEQIGC